MSSRKNPELLKVLVDNKESYFEFLKAKYPVFHNSNVFFRDVQYGIQKYFGKKEIKVTYQDAENLAIEYIKHLEKENIFVKVSSIGWKLNYPDFSAAIPFPKQAEQI